jgi:hypothetical protein
MKNNRLITYLIINIIISALTTLGVLVLWDWVHKPDGPIPPPLFSTAIPTESVQSTLPSSGESILQIENVFGVGRLDSEIVVVKRIGEGELWLTGWKMLDEQNHQFTFPRLLLNKGSINIYTRAGIDTARDLHWGQTKSMWITGEKVRILDPLGNQRAEYIIP